MTMNEVMRFLTIVASSYPQYTKQIQQNLENMSIVWGAFLAEIPFETAIVVLQHLIPKSPYPPTVYDFRRELLKLVEDEVPDAAEAWGRVMNAVRFYGVYRADEALESLDEATRKVVKAIGWREICLAEDLSVIRAHFIKLYEAYSERQLEQKLVNPAAVSGITSKLPNKVLNGVKSSGRIKNTTTQIRSLPGVN